MQGEKGTGIRRALVVAATFCVLTASAATAQAVPPQMSGISASEVTTSSAKLKAEINPGGKLTRWHFEYGTSDCSKTICTSIPVPEAQIPAGSSLVPVEEAIIGLAPGTVYHFLLSAKNGEGGTIKSADRVFATGGISSEVLPDGRAYEQSSPVDKDGNDAVGRVGLVKAVNAGSGITFQSTFGIPGGKGAQALPTYLATRDGGDWSTQGLLPPPEFGERAQVQGWLPDFSETFSNVAKLGSPRVKGLVSQSTTGGPSSILSPYVPAAEYSYVGASANASTVFFESPVALPPTEGEDPIEGAIQGRQNLYAWDRSGGRLSLAGAMNDGKAPTKGTSAGPYDWNRGISASALKTGGALRGYYLQDTHAITIAGDIYFTELGTGQLYLRLNPTQPQSEVVGGKCTKPANACTIHVSASKRSTPDSAGPQPAAFQVASADGSKVFFTSPEKLTADANTGPDQPAPAIGIGSSTTGEIEEDAFIPKRAVGVAVDSKYAYWADPIGGTIGRAELANPTTSIDEGFIEPGPTECEIEVENEEGELEPKTFASPSSPRYISVNGNEIFWTNTGLRDENGEPVDECGTIGHAELDVDENATEVKPDFISGASNPQGIATNATDVYWINTAKDIEKRYISRSSLDGTTVKEKFFDSGLGAAYGLALSSTYVYSSLNEECCDLGYLRRIPLEGGTSEIVAIGKAGIQGLAVNSDYVYWATQGEEAIGRIPITEFGKGNCIALVTCEKEYIRPVGKLFGLAADPSHLYWSVNGETPSNAGNDLYRYESGEDELEDLTPDSADKNGAEVQGVLGVSEDGSRVYFAANGDLDEDGPASRGDCHTEGVHGQLVTTSGSCSVYFRKEGGSLRYVGRVLAGGGERAAGVLNWAGTPRELFSTAGYAPKASFVTKDGEVLLFRSQEKLTPYDNEGVPELYRYSAEDETLRCVSCPPSGEAVGKGPSLESVEFPGPLSPPLASVNMIQSRNLSANGNRVFFQTAEALVPEDTNGSAGCPGVGAQLTPRCTDVYQWEAPGSGSCTQGAPGYSPLNEGCVYLISTGKSPFPSLFADASESGDDVFFFTREGLVGQDTDELQDVYDARVGGGLASQNPPPPNPCLSTESCHEAAAAAPSEQSAGSATFVGPGNQAQKHKKPKATKKKQHHKKSGNKKKGKKKQRANAKGRTGR